MKRRIRTLTITALILFLLLLLETALAQNGTYAEAEQVQQKVVEEPVAEEIEMVAEDEEEVEIDETYESNIPLPESVLAYTRSLCEERGVPFSLALAVIKVESNFNPKAISSTNDYGLMQINICNHESLSKTLGIEDYLDPYDNINAGTYILGRNIKKYGDISMALIAYNRGCGGAEKDFFSKGIYENNYSRQILEAENEILGDIEQI